jgi:RNA recognition motif-containing protein
MPSMTSSLSTTSTASVASLNADKIAKIAGGTSPAPSQGTSDHRTPNVYVNGLPPNFPEEQLLAIAREFGPVQSVRTFTRHVADRPSGYGFILYVIFCFGFSVTRS